ncbi:MAG TPA: hypothetical protein VGM44_11710 [Polyangiaceae bacterium]
MLPASPLSQRTNDDAEAPPASEPSRPTEPWRHPAPVREKLATLDETDFDFHDTIPAPPWLEEPDASEEPIFPRR